jgi:hypothetical protein
MLQNFAQSIRAKAAKLDNRKLNNIGFVNIGASNAGWYTLTMASLGYQVIAFEPMKANHQQLL